MLFHCNEQFLHYQKACLFDDKAAATKIMAATTALACKRLGDKVEHFDQAVWEQECPGIMKQGLRYKFTQSRMCYKALEATGKTRLAEASPYDTLWGTGIGIGNKDLSNVVLWKGKNLMGDALQEIRTELIR